MLFGDLKSSTEVVCQLLEETIQTVANGSLTLHTLIYTFRLEPNIQYLGLNRENAEFLAPLFFFSTSCAQANPGEV